MKNYGLQSSAVTDLSNILKRFEVLRAFEGPQLLLAWELFDDNDIDEFKIIKKEGAYPLSITDGIPVFSGSNSGSYSDLDVSGGTIYYYTLLLRLAGESDFVFDIINMGKALAISTGYYHKKLWGLLPQLYRTRDVITDELQIMEI